MMSSGHRDDPARSAHALESITLREVVHEVVDARAGWRLVPADSDVVFRSRSPFARRHRELSTNAGDPKHRLRRISIELPVKPPNELGRRGLGRRSCGCDAIHFRLHADVRRCFHLEAAPVFVAIEVPRKRAFDVARTGVVSFDEIAVVGVHHTHDVRKVCGGAHV